MKNTLKSLTLAAAAVSGMALAPAMAQNPQYAFGDLYIGFRATGGTGSDNYVIANLGQAGTLRDATNNMTLGVGPNFTLALSTALGANFGGNWFDRTDLFVGVGTSGSNDEFGGFFVNGDPYNTLYVSATRQQSGPNATTVGVRNSNLATLTPNSVQQASNGLFSSSDRFESVGTGAVATIANGLFSNDYDNGNPISSGVQGTAYNVFDGGVQSTVFGTGIFGTIGGIDAEAAVDLFRIQGVNNEPGQFGFGQPTGEGTFEGIIVVESTGQVSLLVVPEPSTIGLLGLSAGLVGFIRRRRAVQA